MFYKNLETKYYNNLLEMAIKNYRKEQKITDALFDIEYRDALSDYIYLLIDKQLGSIAIDEDDKVIGYLAFTHISDTYRRDIKCANSPIYGYGIEDGYDRAKVISMLFQDVSAKLLAKNVGQYEIKVYANDKNVMTSYVQNQFGILCTDAIKKIETPFTNAFSEGYQYCELNKIELSKNKNALLSLWNKLVSHLRKSPTFYPCNEFTDEVYWNHINNPATRVFVAYNSKKIIGIVDVSNDSNCFINDDKKTVNVGDLYIESEFRGKNIAQELLQHVSNTLIKEGYNRIWVEHGTTNPNALRFWGRYFSRFTFTLTRQLDERIFK